MAYYEDLERFTNPQEATIAQMEDVQLPTSKRFFTPVAVVNVLHVFIVGIILYMFWLDGRYILLGNSQSLVALLWGVETEDWLKKADGLKDRAMRKLMVSAENDAIRVGIGDVDGRLQPARKRN
ncbi:hypothetical protein BDZ45DRAFT_682866 [Acephala macrosclerotiorum]|nr:hypothetical protein BDZ45DRAFT_682866 [Acephala macrosclerotiorum]